MSKLDLRTIPEASGKYKLGLRIGGGVGGDVYEAVESQTGKKVAIKVLDVAADGDEEVQREYEVLRQFSGNPNFPEFLGIYGKKGRDEVQKVWLVMELCEGGDAISLVRKVKQEGRPMSELHIAYIMREVIKAVVALHEKEISHRDVRGSNIVLTGDGRVKMVDYGISRRGEKKMKTCVGSASWLAPEVITSQTEGSDGYDKKADVWAIGITAIELGDGQAPFEDMHPGRALFQIVNNPPPTLRKPTEWSQLYRDFISECLVKAPENRPYVQELLVHPFFESLEEEQNLLQDLVALLQKYRETDLYKVPEIQVRNGFMRAEKRSQQEKILQEDLAALPKVSEDSVLFQLHERYKKSEIHTFVGDVLLILNPNKASDEYGGRYHDKYRFKAKSENAPHIYAIADSAYREVFHHEKPQHVIFSGETGAGKTTSMTHALEHLLFLGQGLRSSEKVRKALEVIQVMANAATPHNRDSTRHILQTQVTFTDTGKASGAVFRVYLLEKERITMEAKKQSNFHLFYYFFEALRSEDKLADFHLKDGNYTFLRAEEGANLTGNDDKFRSFENNLKDLGFEEDSILAVKQTLASILLIGEIEFDEDKDENAVLATPEAVQNVAALLGVDPKKLSWALLNYCLIVNGEAIMRHNSKVEAEEAKISLAKGLYSRLLDWIVNTINQKISVSRFIYGDRHVVSLLDCYGIECYKKNGLSQLFVNVVNEQLQYHYNQQMFVWDKQTAEEEEIPFPDLNIPDNKSLIDVITSKPEGLLHKIDEATRNNDFSVILDGFKPGAPIFPETSREFSINHYTGKLTYDASEMPEKNRDFLQPELIDTMRLSKQDVTKQMFSSLLSKSGNLSGQPKRGRNDTPTETTEKIVSTTPPGQYSQSRQMRTGATTFRGACADLFKGLSVRGCGFHFVRCLRTDLSGRPGAFDPEVIRQQLRALSVVNTVLITQQGYSYSASHSEFIRRYKFLAFDFDENVEETKDNCRLLLLRLKLEGWAMGKAKVFLKYFNKEYLSRLYETQIKKIVKVQSMMRAFMTRRKLCAKIRRYQIDADENKYVTESGHELQTEAAAARIIQKRFREYAASKRNLTEEEKAFIRPWCKRWKCKTIFQVLLLYRAERLQVLVNFSLQIHLYNQDSLSHIQRTRVEIDPEGIHPPDGEFPSLKLPIPKLPFTWDCINLRGEVADCEPLPECDIERLESEVYANLKEKMEEGPKKENVKRFEDKEIQTCTEIHSVEKIQETIPELTVTIEQPDDLEIPPREQDECSDVGETEEPMQNSIVTVEQEKPENDTPELVSDGGKEAENGKPSAAEDLTKATTQRLENDNLGNSDRNDEKIKKEDKKLSTVAELKMKLLGKANNDENKLEEQNKVAKDREDAKQPPPSMRTDAPKFQPNRVPAFCTLPSNRKSNLELKFTNEMEEKFRNKDYNEDGDDPPFHFRALLKKTNVSAGPRKKSLTQEFDFRSEIKDLRFPGRKTASGCGTPSNLRRHSDTVMELVPGILIYGKVADL